MKAGPGAMRRMLAFPRRARVAPARPKVAVPGLDDMAGKAASSASKRPQRKGKLLILGRQAAPARHRPAVPAFAPPPIRISPPSALMKKERPPRKHWLSSAH